MHLRTDVHFADAVVSRKAVDCFVYFLSIIGGQSSASVYAFQYGIKHNLPVVSFKWHSSSPIEKLSGGSALNRSDSNVLQLDFFNKPVLIEIQC